ncbi:general transcription factor iih subunit 5 [Phtheirospermum japonicum]|uniref:General transcription and DNA repair factor IIH subunit TFB5 n=1 Tax=Phtheirospermum japonicum TaxID=374723 RepID=A0A830C470_9LAMI|nr:general transcription factor iih subunit 5 [Phtheirospermum japonicum]
MVNAIKGLYIPCDIPMAQFIINMNASYPQSSKFILHVLDNTHIFVRQIWLQRAEHMKSPLNSD